MDVLDAEPAGTGSPEQQAPQRRLRPNLNTMPSEVMDSIGYYLAISSPGSKPDPVGSHAPPVGAWAAGTDPAASSSSRSVATTAGVQDPDAAATALAAALAKPVTARLPFFASEAPAYATPPAQLAHLLLSCRHAYDMLNSEASPRLYSRIFKTKFDHVAIERRFGPDVADPRNLTQELKKRCRGLKKIRATVEGGKVRRPELTREQSQQEMEENLWLAYLMMLENDGKNIIQLRWAQIDAYLTMHYEQEMLESVIQPGYPPESVDRALSLHLQYLLFGGSQLSHESPEESEERMFVLRPYVFAAHKFDAYIAPWTVWRLPADDSTSMLRSQPGMISEDGLVVDTNMGDGQGSGNGSSTASNTPQNPFLADLSFRSKTCVVEHCGRTLSLIAPNLSQAAISIFFQRVERDPGAMGVSHLNESDDQGMHDDSDLEDDAGEEEQGMAGWELAQVFSGMRAAEPASTREERADRRRRRRALREPASLRSIHHDKDLARLMACVNPRSSVGLRPSFQAGDFEGAWEGRFSFFDFDSYRDMLAGLMSSLYEGPFGEQPQVWKISERMVRLGEKDCKGGKGSILSAGYTGTREEEEEEDAYELPRRAPQGLGPSGREFEPLEKWHGAKGPEMAHLPTTFGGSATAPAGRGATPQATSSSSLWTWPKSGSRLIRRLEGDATGSNLDYPSFGADELSTEEMCEYADDPDKFELRLSGTGHSAWGRFHLKGRIRSWDGMMIMKKEYSPDGRGRWLYRGYALAGGRLVGRWRDTFTPENMSGYEGCFCFHKRGAT